MKACTTSWYQKENWSERIIVLIFAGVVPASTVIIYKLELKCNMRLTFMCRRALGFSEGRASVQYRESLDVFSKIQRQMVKKYCESCCWYPRRWYAAFLVPPPSPSHFPFFHEKEYMAPTVVRVRYSFEKSSNNSYDSLVQLYWPNGLANLEFHAGCETVRRREIYREYQCRGSDIAG